MADPKKPKTETPAAPAPTAPAAAAPPIEATALVTTKPAMTAEMVPANAVQAVDVVAAKNQTISLLRGLLEKYSGNERDQLLTLIESVDPDKEGLEEMGDGFVVPIIRIVQGTTRDVPDGCQKGDLFTSFGSKVERPFRFIPLYGFKMNRMFPPEGALGRPTCTSPDGVLGNTFGKCAECPQLPLGVGGSQPTQCDSVIVFLVMSDTFRIARIEFQRMSRKAGQRLNQLVRERPKIWDRLLSLNTTSMQSEKGPPYHVFTVSAGGQDTPAHLREASAALKILIEAERKASLHVHYAAVLAGGKRASQTDENLDVETLGIGGNENPDLSTGGV